MTHLARAALPLQPLRTLRGETGLLVAFGSGLVHAVMPVRRGERHTVATWFA